MLIFCCNQPKHKPTDEVYDEPEETVKEISFDTYSAGDSNEAYLISLEVMLPELENDPVVENIRRDIMGIFNVPNANDPQTVLNRQLQQKKVEFTEMHSELVGDGFYDDYVPQLEDRLTVLHLSHNKYFMTYVLSSYGYYGGAHGGGGKGYRLYDMATGNQITESGFLTNKSAVTNLLRTKALKEYTNENPGFEVFDKDNITAKENFFVTPDSLIYQFGEYEIAAYCYGRPTFRLHKNEVKPYTNPESPIYKYWFGE